MGLRECSELPHKSCKLRGARAAWGSCVLKELASCLEKQLSLGFLPLRGPGLLLGRRWGLPGGSCSGGVGASGPRLSVYAGMLLPDQVLQLLLQGTKFPGVRGHHTSWGQRNMGQASRDWAQDGLGWSRLLTFHPRRSARARQPWSQSPSQATSLRAGERVQACPGLSRALDNSALSMYHYALPPLLDLSPVGPSPHSRLRPHL